MGSKNFIKSVYENTTKPFNLTKPEIDLLLSGISSLIDQDYISINDDKIVDSLRRKLKWEKE